MEKGIKLAREEVTEDLSSKYNVCYVICAVAGAIICASESILIGVVFGLLFGWIVKGPILLKTATYKFRTMDFWLPRNVTVEDIYANVSGYLREQDIYVTLQGNDLEFQHGAIHYQYIADEADGTFRLRWYFSGGKALFGERYVSDYQVVRHDTGMIAYMIQQITV